MCTPLLWESFTTDLKPTHPIGRTRRWANVLSPQSNIPKHVQKSTLYRDGDNFVELQRMKCRERIRMMDFLNRLKKNQLTEFRSNQAMDLDAVRTLLSCQASLRVLKLPLATSDGAYAEVYADCHLSKAPWLKGSLLKLETLMVFVPGENTVNNMNEYMDAYHFLFDHAPRMKNLEVESTPIQRCSMTENITLPTRASMNGITLTMRIPQSLHRVNLDRLTLSFLDFHNSTFLMREINFLGLEVLRIKFCLHEDLLLSVIACLFEKGKPKLKHFELGVAGKDRNAYGMKAISDTVDKLLFALSGLEVFHLDTNYLGEPPLLKGILQHAKSLKSLSIGGKDWNYSLDGEYVATILTKCPNLDEAGSVW